MTRPRPATRRPWAEGVAASSAAGPEGPEGRLSILDPRMQMRGSEGHCRQGHAAQAPVNMGYWERLAQGKALTLRVFIHQPASPTPKRTLQSCRTLGDRDRRFSQPSRQKLTMLSRATTSAITPEAAARSWIPPISRPKMLLELYTGLTSTEVFHGGRATLFAALFRGCGPRAFRREPKCVPLTALRSTRTGRHRPDFTAAFAVERDAGSSRREREEELALSQSESSSCCSSSEHTVKESQDPSRASSGS